MNFLLKIFGVRFDDLWEAIIRPKREEYTKDMLGKEKFEIEGKFYMRKDIEILNKRNKKLQCSFWRPISEAEEDGKLPCVVYLHGNSSSRLESLVEIKYLLPTGITVFSFDFSGCGQSEGEYITLGYREKDDVECVIDYLKKSGKVSKIGLWGRSMGAVTALCCASENKDVEAIVCDSPFGDLKELIFELSNSRIPLPNFLLEFLFNKVKETIIEKVGFNIENFRPKSHSEKCSCPILFCHGK